MMIRMIVVTLHYTSIINNNNINNNNNNNNDNNNNNNNNNNDNSNDDFSSPSIATLIKSVRKASEGIASAELLKSVMTMWNAWICGESVVASASDGRGRRMQSNKLISVSFSKDFCDGRRKLSSSEPLCLAMKTKERNKKKRNKRRKKNKYRGGTKDATTSSSLIVLLLSMMLEKFPH